jgi:hypothetical protein
MRVFTLLKIVGPGQFEGIVGLEVNKGASHTSLKFSLELFFGKYF